jgi:hypothetical protein
MSRENKKTQIASHQKGGVTAQACPSGGALAAEAAVLVQQRCDSGSADKAGSHLQLHRQMGKSTVD